MSDNNTHLTDRIDEIAREKGAKIKASIDSHVARQSGRLDKHLEGAQALFSKLPGTGSGPKSDES